MWAFLGHTVQVDVAGNVDGADQYVTYNGKRYQFLQFHFHGPSEHLVEVRRPEGTIVNMAQDYVTVTLLFPLGT